MKRASSFSICVPVGNARPRAVASRGITALCALFLVISGCSGGSSSGISSSPPPSNPIPSIVSLSPASAVAGSGAFILTVNGSGFDSGSSIEWNGSAKTTTFVSSSQLTASIAAADISTAGTANVSVVNPAPGGGTSAVSSFQVSAPTPTVTIMASPATITLGSATTLTWSSTNATSCNASGSWSGTQAVSGTQIVTPTATGTAAYTLTCTGAGGTANGSASVTVNAPSPSLTISVSPAAIAPGSSATLNWAAVNAVSCTASGAWNGTQQVSGTQTVTETILGNYGFSLACTGDGGTASKTASLLVTRIKPSSYENKNNMGIAPVSLAALNAVNAFAVSDFFGDGSTALVLHTLEYNPNDPSTYNNYGHIRFYKKDQTGTWTDETSTLLTNNVGCLHPRKAAVADFNRDGRPDVYFACHGLDAPPYPGEHPHVLLSQPDGTYQNVTLAVTCYCHSASAADVNDDGYPDVLVTDTSVAQTPYFLINQTDGTFKPDYSRLPNSSKGKQIYTAELIDFSGSGKYDVFLAGNEPGTTSDPGSEYGPTILPNDGTGNFASSTPVSLLTGNSFGLALDIVFQNGYAYLLKVNHNYTSSDIEKVSYPAISATSVYLNSTTYPNGSTWLDWIVPYNGELVSEDASYGVAVPD